jgi:hypothetical protein
LKIPWIKPLEKQIAEQANSAMVQPEADTTEGQATPPAQAIAEPKVLEQLMARRADPEQITCAESLVGFARAAHADLDDVDREEITISSNKTLQLEEQGNQVAITLNNHQGNTLFAGNRTDGQWARVSCLT